MTTIALALIVVTPTFVMLAATSHDVLLCLVPGVVAAMLTRAGLRNGEKSAAQLASVSAATASLAAVAILLTMQSTVSAWMMPFSIFCAAGVAALVERTLWWRDVQQVCALCRTRLKLPNVVVCPRCHDSVCPGQNCWSAANERCQRCQRREVPMLPHRDIWWQTRLGPRVTAGECIHCGKDAAVADLRECGQCRFALCRRCWDQRNGGCSQCRWVIPGVRELLKSSWVPAQQRFGARSLAQK